MILGSGEYEGGYYIGKIVLPSTYPTDPGNFYMLTPQGRFKPSGKNNDEKICLTNSGYHKESWTPMWNIKNMVIAFVSIFQSDDTTGISHIKQSPQERKEMAKNSMKYNLEHYPEITMMFTQFVKPDGTARTEKEVKEYIATLKASKNKKKEKIPKDIAPPANSTTTTATDLTNKITNSSTDQAVNQATGQNNNQTQQDIQKVIKTQTKQLPQEIKQPVVAVANDNKQQQTKTSKVKVLKETLSKKEDHRMNETIAEKKEPKDKVIPKDANTNKSDSKEKNIKVVNNNKTDKTDKTNKTDKTIIKREIKTVKNDTLSKRDDCREFKTTIIKKTPNNILLNANIFNDIKKEIMLKKNNNITYTKWRSDLLKMNIKNHSKDLVRIEF
jgi:ubiquitin-protein ligase